MVGLASFILYVVTHGHVSHVVIVVTKSRFDLIPMHSDGLAVKDEEHLRSGVVCLASAPAEVMIFQGLPLPLCRAELRLGCPYHISATGSLSSAPSLPMPNDDGQSYTLYSRPSNQQAELQHL
jgi:hypothetical protein